MIENPYTRLIAEFDRVLSMLRTLWLEAETPAVREKWRSRLDQSLDERLLLMRRREAFDLIALPRSA
jgi:hypothetical protein